MPHAFRTLFLFIILPIAGVWPGFVVGQPAAKQLVCDPQAHIDIPAPAPKPGEPLRCAEEMPQFDGNLNQYIAANLHYPDSARDHEQEGRPWVSFVVDTSGLICDLQIRRSSGFPLLDAAALRALYPMEYAVHWKPGKHLGKKVPVYFTLPLRFCPE